jgi:putative phosphoesterase
VRNHGQVSPGGGGGVRIGVVSDAHGNLAGFEAAIAAMGPVDRLLFAGDVLGYYFEAPAIIARLHQLEAICVLGDHDVIFLEYLGFRVDPSWFAPAAASYRRRYGPSLERAAIELRPVDVRWLAGLATHRELVLDGLRVLLCHGSPWQTTDGGIDTDSTRFPEFRKLEHDLVVMGHTHRPFVRSEGAVTLVNAGACGQPRDGDPAASYAIIDTDGGRRPVCTIGRASYDRAPLLEKCETIAPDVPLLTELLTHGGLRELLTCDGLPESLR